MLENEVHPRLNRQELEEIREFREKLAYKTRGVSEKMIFNWSKSGKLTQRQFVLLVKYYFQGFS